MQKPRHAVRETGPFISSDSCPAEPGFFTRQSASFEDPDCEFDRFGLINLRYQTVPSPFGSGLSVSAVAPFDLHALLALDSQQSQRRRAMSACRIDASRSRPSLNDFGARAAGVKRLSVRSRRRSRQCETTIAFSAGLRRPAQNCFAAIHAPFDTIPVVAQFWNRRSDLCVCWGPGWNQGAIDELRDKGVRCSGYACIGFVTRRGCASQYEPDTWGCAQRHHSGPRRSCRLPSRQARLASPQSLG